MASIDELKQTRLNKLESLIKSGMNPYPVSVPRDFSLEEAQNKFKEYEKSQKQVSLAGRIMAIRGQGAILFFVLDDGTAKFQAVAKKDAIEPKLFKLITDTVDIGDIVSVTGILFTTQKGEESLLIADWKMAAKSLLPLPEKWHGLQDPDEKLRKRYLDFIMAPEKRELFYKKAKFWQLTRKFMEDRGFIEVETPTLETTTGGAEARPFITHHNDYDLDVYLRISVGELWQKRLMAAGFPKTFEIGRVYRNEGSSPEHVQEFTNMEYYWSYADYEDGMNLTVELYRHLAKEVFGTTKFDSRGHSFDLSEEWQKIDYGEEVKKQTSVDINMATDEELLDKVNELKIDYDGNNRERLIDTLWKYCRKNIAGPAFLINHPILVAPLAKSVPGKSGTVQMFQPIIAGSEIGRGYSELNDPIDQKKRFEEQLKLFDAGDKEAMMPDWEFVEMLEHAMPPTCGFGFGERLFSVLAGQPLRETQLFPLVRPKKN
ncbi:lysine--tRNA ligase [Patescibacteria group bacterium]|nr:lysine--tRNA ligase [Patescibacteria group bacterium]MDE1946554.1 lysine--tRNA ligase [Patescibacteria group bacterium]MDE2010885.1 lysine--tRNA ligase [Patescibacteria group bacterium]MDE2232769.1 lysine--tRNA ligase [Patescibacteria group bacterium]